MFTQGCHAFTLVETPVSLDGNLTETYKKVVRFRRKRKETWVNVMYPLTETYACRHVSATVKRVYVKFPFTETRYFVL